MAVARNLYLTSYVMTITNESQKLRTEIHHTNMAPM